MVAERMYSWNKVTGGLELSGEGMKDHLSWGDEVIREENEIYPDETITKGLPKFEESDEAYWKIILNVGPDGRDLILVFTSGEDLMDIVVDFVKEGMYLSQYFKDQSSAK